MVFAPLPPRCPVLEERRIYVSKVSVASDYSVICFANGYCEVKNSHYFVFHWGEEKSEPLLIDGVEYNS
jgi:hypothetical protein